MLDRVRCRVRVIVRFTVTVRFRSQEALGTETTTVLLSPRRAEWSTQGKVSVRISLWVPRPDKFMGQMYGSPLG